MAMTTDEIEAARGRLVVLLNKAIPKASPSTSEGAERKDLMEAIIDGSDLLADLVTSLNRIAAAVEHIAYNTLR